MREVQLAADVWSCFGLNNKDRVPYGKRFEKVKVVADHGNVLIVEAKSGKRFSVHVDQIIKEGNQPT